MKPGLVRAALAVAALSAMVAGCSGSGQATDSVAQPGPGTFWVHVSCHDDRSDASALQRAINTSSRGATIAIGGSCMLTSSITLLPDRSYTGSSATSTYSGRPPV